MSNSQAAVTRACIKSQLRGALLVVSAFVALSIGHSSSFAEDSSAARTLAHLRRAAPRISTQLLELTLQAVSCAGGHLNTVPRYIGVIDYSLPSTQKRFWLLDLQDRRLLREELVAHGKNTGELRSARFSNEPGSLQSSLGLFLAGDTYLGQHGYSLRLHGLEEGFNDRALDRAVVMHGASYVSAQFVDRWRRLGRSWGCPALSLDAIATVVDHLKDGGLLFAYYPDKKWLSTSRFLNGCTSGKSM